MTQTRLLTKLVSSAMSIALAGAAGCADPGDGEDDVSNLPSATSSVPSDNVVRVWNAYAACPEGCELPLEDAQLLEDFFNFAQTSTALSQDSRDIIQILGSEMTAAGYHVSQIANVAPSLPSYNDPRVANLFTSREVCTMMDEFDGNPPGTFLCEVSGPVSEETPTPYWVEPISKGAVLTAAIGATIGLTVCSVNMATCYNAAEHAWRNANTQCDARTQFLDRDCSYAVYVNHHNRCKPCGGSHTNIIDHRFCCRNREN
jgi:hypothetical protein